MEEHISKLICKHIYEEDNMVIISTNICAKEIAEHFEKFDYWKAYNTVRHKGKFNNIKDQFEVVVANKIVWINSLAELYSYYLKEIIN